MAGFGLYEGILHIIIFTCAGTKAAPNRSPVEEFCDCFYITDLATTLDLCPDQDWPTTDCPGSFFDYTVVDRSSEVQHLIERCLILRMSCYDCVEALARHARIRPLVTLTVWRELLKENRGFFQAYYQAILPRPITYKPIQRVSRFRRRKPWK